MLILRIFGVSVGLVIIVYSLAVMDGALVGPGPCRPHCGLYRAIIDFIGQAGFNAFRGLVGLAVGMILIYAATFVLGRDKPGKKKR